MTSFKAEVIADSSGTWAANLLRFDTRANAEAYVRDLARRWTLVRETRVVECDDPVSYTWHEDVGPVACAPNPHDFFGVSG